MVDNDCGVGGAVDSDGAAHWIGVPWLLAVTCFTVSFPEEGKDFISRFGLGYASPCGWALERLARLLV